MGKCKGCGREIIWIMTPSGKCMPCDPELVPYWEAPKARQKIVTRQGNLVSCDLEPRSEKETGTGYIPHWSTCPVAGQFKRRG